MLAADDLPPHTVAVSTPIRVRIYQETGESMLPDSFKEIPRTRLRSEWQRKSTCVSVERGQDLVLLFRGSRRELVHAGKKLSHSFLQFGQTLKVDFPVITGKRLQGAVDEVNDSSLAGTRRIVGRDDACGD